MDPPGGTSRDSPGDNRRNPPFNPPLRDNTRESFNRRTSRGTTTGVISPAHPAGVPTAEPIQGPCPEGLLVDQPGEPPWWTNMGKLH